MSNFLQDVFATSKSVGLAHGKMVALLKTAGPGLWADEAQRKACALEFQLGRMCAILGLKTRSDALTIRELRAPSADPTKDGDDRRTDRQQKAYRASVSAWDYAAKEAGMPANNGGTRASPVRAGSTPEPKDKGAHDLAFPSPKNAQDAREFAQAIAKLCVDYQHTFATIVPGDIARTLTAVAAQLRQACKTQDTKPAPKPEVKKAA